MKMLLKSIKEYKVYAILTPIFVILEVIMEVIIPFLMAILIDEGIEMGNISVVFYLGIILIFLAFLSLLFGVLSGKFASIASNGFAKNLRKAMFYKIEDYSFYNIDKFSSSSIVTRLTTDVSNVQQSFQMIIRIVVRAPLMMICSLIMAFSINSNISLIFLIIMFVLSIILFMIVKKSGPLFTKVFKSYDVLNNTVQENIRNIRIVKSFANEEYEKQKFGEISNKIYKLFVNAEKIVVLNNPVMRLAMYSCILLISYIGSKQIVYSLMSTGELTSLITYATTILSSLMMISLIYVMITMSIPSIKRCVEILKETPDIKNPKKPIFNIKDGSIEFKDVDFSYDKDQNKCSLNDINLSIKSGEFIGIIGSTGSSKSSLVNLIPRLFDVTKGNVYVGGVDVREYDIKSLRDNVSMVLQKNILFSGTILDNLKWGNNNATMEEIEKACELSCIKDFILSLDKKYDTYIEQGGANLSGGQKQRLCIARALLKNPKILILDDSTSAVDVQTDKKIRETFKEYLPVVTKIIIAQRIDSVNHCDRVIVMDEGRINAIGTPKELLKTNAIYKEVYNSQKKEGKTK